MPRDVSRYMKYLTKCILIKYTVILAINVSLKVTQCWDLDYFFASGKSRKFMVLCKECLGNYEKQFVWREKIGTKTGYFVFEVCQLIFIL